MAALSAVLRKANSIYCSSRLPGRHLSNAIVKIRCCLSVAQSRRTHSSHVQKVNLWKEYNRLKQSVEGCVLPQNKIPSEVFSNNELQLGEIEVYGFDYDYTIACYKDSLNRLIYNLGRTNLINEYKYPLDIENAMYEYNPSFAVRGLHCDVKRGYLMKIDAFHNIQLGSVYCGLQPVSDATVLREYGGLHVPIEQLSNYYGSGPNMIQLMDQFALPEMNLYANVIEFLSQHDITYDPEHVFYDVRHAVQSLHVNSVIHKHIMEHHEMYLVRQPEIRDMLVRLSNGGKKMFLITNSSAQFVDKGMTYLVGSDWNQLFDVVITHARKPKFFYEANRPFRMYDHKLGVKTWNRVDKLHKGCVYQEGNYSQLISLTGWTGNRVLYIGDHVYTDLADATLKLGWRTGAIIPELEDEIRIINTESYKKSVSWLIALESLISNMQVHQDAESQQILAEWIAERNLLRLHTKNLFNKRFGSLFRTYHNATYFTRRLNRFADIYMSSIVNLHHYPLNYAFYPRRTALPHEFSTFS